MSVAQKNPIPPTHRRRKRAGVSALQSAMMHLVQTRALLKAPLDRNPQADIAMLLNSLLLEVDQAIGNITVDCRKRGYAEVDDILRDVQERVETTHARRSKNAREHQAGNKRTRVQFENAADQHHHAYSPAQHQHPRYGEKMPRSSFIPSMPFEEPLL